MILNIRKYKNKKIICFFDLLDHKNNLNILMQHYLIVFDIQQEQFLFELSIVMVHHIHLRYDNDLCIVTFHLMENDRPLEIYYRVMMSTSNKNRKINSIEISRDF